MKLARSETTTFRQLLQSPRFYRRGLVFRWSSAKTVSSCIFKYRENELELEKRVETHLRGSRNNFKYKNFHFKDFGALETQN